MKGSLWGGATFAVDGLGFVPTEGGDDFGQVGECQWQMLQLLSASIHCCPLIL
jgi:hypothetical protein